MTKRGELKLKAEQMNRSRSLRFYLEASKGLIQCNAAMTGLVDEVITDWLRREYRLGMRAAGRLK